MFKHHDHLMRTALIVLIAATAWMPGATVFAQAKNAEPASASTDLFGEAPPQLDPEKAHVPFSELTPVVEIASDANVPNDPLPDRAQRALDRAETLRAENRYTEAMIELEKAQRIARSDPRILRALAFTAWQAGDQKRARKHVTEALNINDDDTTCHYILARLAASRFENQTAIIEYRKALASTLDVDVWVLRKAAELDLAEMLLAEGYVQASIDIHQDILHRSGVYDYANAQEERLDRQLNGHRTSGFEQLGWAQAKLGAYDKAVENLRTPGIAEALPPDRLVDYAKLLARAGEFDEAIKQARKALASDPKAVDVLAAIYKHQNRPEALVEEITATTEGDADDPKLLIARAEALIGLGRDDEAVEITQAVAAKHPDQMDIVAAAVKLFAASARWSLVSDTLANAVRDKPPLSVEVTQLIEALDHEAALKPLLDSIGESAQYKSAQYDHAQSFVFAQAAKAMDQTEVARAWFDRALEDRPSFIPARIGLARMYLDQWRWEDAMTVASPEHPKLERDTRLEMILGEAMRGLDKIEEAINHYESAVRLHRANTEAMLVLAELYSARGDQAASRRQLEKILRIDTFNHVARSRLCLNHIDSGDRRAAAEQLQELRLHRAPPTVVAQCVAALEYDAQSPDHERFRRTLQEGMTASKPDVDTLQLLGMSYMQQSNWTEAIKQFEAALQIDPRHTETSTLLLECFQKDLQFEKALALQGELLKRHPARRIWQNNLLHLQLVVQQYDDAIQTAQAFIDEAGANPALTQQYKAEIIETHMLRKEYASAIKALEEWRKTAKDNPAILRVMISACQSAGDHDRAMELIREWGSDIPGGYGRTSMEPIWRELQPEQRGEVTELLLDAIAIDPQNEQLHISLIELLRSSGKLDDALALARNSAVSGVYHDGFMEEMHLTLEAAGRIDEAVEVIEDRMGATAEAAEKEPAMHAYYRQTLAVLLMNNGRVDDAVARLQRWLEQAKGDRDLETLYLNLLAIAHQEAGDLEKARDALNRSFELNPTDVGLHNDLGYTLADAGVDLERAERLIRFAVGELPRTSAYLDSLGWVLYKKGDFAEARRWLELARGGQGGEDPVICDHLGDTCWRLGDKDAALKWWREGLQFANKRLELPPSRPSDRQAAETAKSKLSAVDEGLEPKLAPIGEPPDPNSSDSK